MKNENGNIVNDLSDHELFYFLSSLSGSEFNAITFTHPNFIWNMGFF